jgi:hypothetical protein
MLTKIQIHSARIEKKKSRREDRTGNTFPPIFPLPRPDALDTAGELSRLQPASWSVTNRGDSLDHGTENSVSRPAPRKQETDARPQGPPLRSQRHESNPSSLIAIVR